jgi:4-diphosphocytidyl-2-C-methyl-D-erythritol kinase
VSTPSASTAGPALSIRAYAKINLSLQVSGRRADGYHELRTVFQSISLHDTLIFSPRDGPFELRCREAGVPLDDRNLVWKAGALLWGALGRTGDPRGIAVEIRKRIPPQAGLGGGSADGAAALVALARMWGVAPGERALARLAAELGADVPFFLVGGTALGLDRGDEICAQVDGPRSWVVLVLPGFGIPTSEAFEWYDADAAEQTLPLPRADDPGNDLEAPVVRRHPEIGEILATLRGLGAARASMSGSGSAAFGLFADRTSASRAADALGGRLWRVMVSRTLTRAEYLRRSAPGGPHGSALSPGGSLV